MRARSASLRLLAIASLVLALAQASSSVSRGQDPSAVASSPARFIPKDNLLIYVEYQGLDAQPEAWAKTAASKILNNTPTGAMLEDVANQLFERLAIVAKQPALAAGGFVPTLKRFTKNGFTFALIGNPAKPNSPSEAIWTLVFRNAYKDKELRSFMAGLFSTFNAPNTKPQSVVRVGHKVITGTTATGLPFSWWVEDSKKEDIILVFGKVENVDIILETVDGKRPSIFDDPKHAELLKSDKQFVPNGVAYLGPRAFEAGQLEETLGFRNVTTLDIRWGFQDDALLTLTRIATSGPRKGLLALLDGSTLDKGKLPPIPDNVSGFTVASFDMPATLDKLVALAKSFKPDAEDQVGKFVDTLKARSKLRLKEDVLAHLGPKVAWYILPNRAGGAAPAAGPNMFSAILAGAGMDQVPKLALVFDIDDSTAFGKMLDDAMAAANREFKSTGRPPGEPAAKGGRGRGPTPPAPEFQQMSGETKMYVLKVPPELAGQFPASFRPAIRVGPKHVVLAVSPDVARAALETKTTWKPEKEVADAYQGLPAKLKVLNVADPRETLPPLLASLPAKIQTIINTATMIRPPTPPVGGPNPGNPRAPGAPGAPAGGPAAGGPAPLVLRIDAAKLPSADAIKALLFPSLFAVELNGDEIRIVSREAFPSVGDVSKGATAMPLIMSAIQAMFAGGRPPGIPLPPPGGQPPAGAPAAPSAPPGRPRPGTDMIRP